MEAVVVDGSWQAEHVRCDLCRFYHHSDGHCRRRAPDPTYDRVQLLFEKAMEAFGKEFEWSNRCWWPSVEADDFCGEFERGVGMGAMTLEAQKSEGFIPAKTKESDP